MHTFHRTEEGLVCPKAHLVFPNHMNYSNKKPQTCLSYNFALQIYKLSHKLYHHFNSILSTGPHLLFGMGGVAIR